MGVLGYNTGVNRIVGRGATVIAHGLATTFMGGSYMSDHTTRNESPKLCECGCGQPAPIAVKTNVKDGYIKGQPIRFVHGHNRRGSYVPTKKPVPVVERFWAKVKVGKPDECWEWQASTDGRGYGQLNGGNRSLRAHRVSYELHFGSIPDGLDVCHRCDNRRCVNPHHLFVGTRSDNVQDMLKKGRGNFVPQVGSKNHLSKLHEDDIPEIRELAAGGLTCAAIASRFGVTAENISMIVRRLTWSHVP
jgi:hypothetical protein